MSLWNNNILIKTLLELNVIKHVRKKLAWKKLDEGKVHTPCFQDII